ncbi:hypothetical protein AVEN_94917-1 [Araneus ventricosus]|uniref:Uncharacterized protein n=1 Tax=Araneus ventricosus TaxID=182803 RepID=A0A4Y2DLB2_ARAVE|nr:hypothetical protein AVEN_94917-1 [Araneus ventricosus]
MNCLLLLSLLEILMVIAHYGAVRIQILVGNKLRSSLILTPFAYLTTEKYFLPTSINEVELSTLWTSHYARRLLLLTLTLELELTCVTATISQFLDCVNVGSNDAQRPSSYLFHRADFTNFTLRALITRDMVEGNNINEVMNFVTKTIISSADASIPKSGLSFPKNRKPWWNKHCTDTNRNQRKAWNAFRRHPISANQIAKGIARWARRKSEREYWIKFVSSINSSIKEKDMWDNVRRACGIYSEKRISCLGKNGQEVCNTLEMVEVLAEAFALFAQQVSIPNLSSHIKIVRNALSCASRRQNIYLTTLT